MGGLAWGAGVAGSGGLGAGDRVGTGSGMKVGMGAGMPSFDLLRMRYESEEGRGFDDGEGEVVRDEYSIRSFLSKPIALGGGWKGVPLFEYSFTNLNFGDMGAGVPFEDQDLHEFGLNALLFKRVEGSDWTYGMWGRVRLASDLSGVNADDLFYDFGLGVGYRVNGSLLVGLAFVGLEVGGDALYVPGPVVMWGPSEDLSFALMGPLLVSTWKVADAWHLSLKGRPNGGIWNVDDGGESRDYDLSSYVLRLHSDHRVGEKWWVSLGVGYAFGGGFEVRGSDGGELFEDDLGGGLSFSVGLSLSAW